MVHQQHSSVLLDAHHPAAQFVGIPPFEFGICPKPSNYRLMHTCTLQEAEAILEHLSPSPLQIFGFGVALLAVPYALLGSGRLRSTSTISLNSPAYTKQVFHQE
ncbi:calcium sensing receptor, chloroplastic [Senna tora]|uniref:Calcium sensing receptor, chloroplastic n=1 Tax=Senna tora TaxID=362788 RepID=A0A834WG05_9FABA|nr:calcium sensing receptor, chloroplastic [Senna tora]